MHMLPVLLSSSVTVLDCGSHRTALAVFRRTRTGRLQLRRFLAENLAIESGAGAAWLDQTAAALRVLRRKVRSPGPVTLVLPAHLALTKLIRVPQMEAAKQEKIIRFEAQENIPYPLAEVAWDHVVLRAGDGGGEVLLAAAKLDVIDPLCATVEAAGFDLGGMWPAVLTTLAAARLAAPSTGSAVLHVNVGIRSAILVLRDKEQMQFRTLSLGGPPTEAVASNPAGDDSRPPDSESRERVEPDSRIAGEELAARLAEEITRSVLHFQRHAALRNPERILLTGPGSRLRGFSTALAARLALPVERPGWRDVVEFCPDSGVAGNDDASAELSDLIGAAALLLLPAPVSLNLLPSDRRARQEFRRRRPWLVLAAGLAACALAAPLLQTRQAITEVRRRIAEEERTLVPLRSSAARLAKNLRQLERVNSQLAALRRGRDARTGWLGLLADLQLRLGIVEDVWLERMQVVPAGPKSKPESSANPPVSPLRIAVSGRILDRSRPGAAATDAASGRAKNLLRSLAASPYVAAVEEERFDESQPGLWRFELVLRCRGDRPL